ncbi:hypothetical protein FPZ43_09595 [Mucilaginibacter pallidiroseus]|uniref:Outer membrane protein beta-barrel domain-containing protein n=1 Tax=Mucilaginibacter pallidiroseus TaxID=2599295 RepID=A0A563UCX8_9SPHI|nr:hypothetical protein [Mucilaginibacter pallidiroseus]TWR29218.1 hypothetical protein FPZ43_09595 [Mucilaginibacter pallidiroseus]
MKTFIFAAALAVLAVCVSTQTKAQSIEKGKLRFGIGADALLPVGNFSHSTNFGLGVTPRLQYGLSNKVALTFTSGIYHFFPKNMYAQTQTQLYAYKWDLDLIPVKVGFKAFVSSHIYIGGEAGMGFQVDNGGGDSEYLYSGTVGYANKKWDFGIRYENISGNGYRNGMIGLRVAYGFGL